MPRTTADLQAVVDYARLLDQRLLVRGPGHDTVGSDLWGSVLVNTALMTDIDVEVGLARGT
jgi:FAD/FMN-containing dehydrogenase